MNSFKEIFLGTGRHFYLHIVGESSCDHMFKAWASSRHRIPEWSGWEGNGVWELRRCLRERQLALWCECWSLDLTLGRVPHPKGVSVVGQHSLECACRR